MADFRGIKTRVATNQLTNSYDPFEINYDERPYELFTDAELQAEAGGILTFDSECFPNYFLVAFKSVQSHKVVYFEISDKFDRFDEKKLWWILSNFWIVGFNSNNYDIPLICFATHKASCVADFKFASNQLIYGELHPAEFYKHYEIHRPAIKQFDLIEVAPLMASLKTYGGRLHAARMQELPVKHDEILDERKINAVRFYCINDLDLTETLFLELKPQLSLRWQLSQDYGSDLLSKSDTQIAEAVICSELKRKNGGWLPKKPTIEPGTIFHYKVPRYLEYQLPQLQQMLEVVRNADFKVAADGSIEMPPEIAKLRIRIGSCLYRMGIGGLHSSESCAAYRADENTLLIDKDVASYYPSIILSLELFPKHLGKAFLGVYRDIVTRRLEAKRTKNKVVADSLKITINGSFGKLGNRYSILYSPDLMMQVTMTGQLCLLMLIELIENVGIPVVSANTDGVVMRCPKDRYSFLEAAVVHWENLTSFETEETRYKAIYSRDVNNYIAVKEDDTCKVKGVYSERGSALNSILAKNPEVMICADAVTNFLVKGTPVEKTIQDCKDVRRFVSVRNVKGGAEKGGIYLGKSIRWYYSTEARGQINYVTTGNKVPKTDDAMPLMDLPTELPSDIDYNYYIKTAVEMLKEIGYYGNKQSESLFD